MSDLVERVARAMWRDYAIQAGGKTFDGKLLPSWDELGDERQSCWFAAARAALRVALEEAARECERLLDGNSTANAIRALIPKEGQG